MLFSELLNVILSKAPTMIVLANFVLYNFIWHWNIEDELFEEALNEMMEEDVLADERE